MEEKQTKYVFSDTEATRKVFKLKKRIRAVKGGTSASKTISILMWHIDYCQQKRPTKEICTIASETFPHLESGAIRDFKAIMMDRGYWQDSRWNATKHFYTFETGNTLEFMSVDTYGKAHGPRRDVLFLNECNNLDWNIVDQLIMRTRKIVWMDWNPTESFWFHENLLPYRADDIDYITLTYLDNDALDEITVHEIESHQHNKQWWQVYGLGQDGETEDRVYTGWDIIDEIPKEARIVRKGLDFGFTNDPTVIIDVYEYNQGFILDEIVYQRGLFNVDIARLIGRNQPLCIADSADPQNIAEIAMYGVNIIGAKKGKRKGTNKGSIQHGIDAVRSRKISITKRSVHTIKEYRGYVFMKDINGKATNEPIKINDHGMDAARYAISSLIPEVEPEDAYIPETEYETPSISSSTPENKLYPILTVQGPSKNRMQFLLDRKKENSEDFYESDTPWQKPGI